MSRCRLSSVIVDCGLAAGLLWIPVSMVLTSACVEERCLSDQDCPHPKVCNSQGKCSFMCTESSECGTGFACELNLCVPEEHKPVECPDDMVAVNSLFCIDRYEASRPDATADSQGVDNSMAQSKPGVLPWEVGEDNATAAAACEGAGKRLCTAFEWELTCRGPDASTYGYGDSYQPETCNGIDTFGRQGMTLLPTGSLAGCIGSSGAYDVNGNLWEHVADGDGTTVRGGAYNCIDSMSLHRCDYIPRTWVPSALGFRCCWTPPDSRGTLDVQALEDVTSQDIPAIAETVETGGCLDPDVGQDLPTDQAFVPQCTGNEDCVPLLGDLQECQVAHCAPPGVCEVAAAKDATECDDGDPCSIGDICAEAVCVAGPDTLDCDDGNPCTQDLCLGGEGCSNLPLDNEPCDDQNPCTTEDQCLDGVCIGATGICQCTQDEDCLEFEDNNLCNGILHCNTETFPSWCEVIAGTVVTCATPPDPCKNAKCIEASGLCQETAAPEGTPCDDDDPCTEGDQCMDGLCLPGALDICGCPADMVLIADQFCLDKYEASRVDATASSQGSDTSMANSKAGVIPWFPVDLATATAACLAAGKRVCTEAEMNHACGGTDGHAYVYGDTYSATICNGIDAFCNCSAPPCSDLEICPYPHCQSSDPEGVWGQGCGAYFHVTPTGSFPDCQNSDGAFDINGNVWELVDIGNEESWYKGGAYNCSNSEYLHDCGGLFQNISAKGFRCCRDASLPAGGL